MGLCIIHLYAPVTMVLTLFALLIQKSSVYTLVAKVMKGPSDSPNGLLRHTVNKKCEEYRFSLLLLKCHCVFSLCSPAIRQEHKPPHFIAFRLPLLSTSAAQLLQHAAFKADQSHTGKNKVSFEHVLFFALCAYFTRI